MGNDQQEGMALLVCGVTSLAQSIGLVREFTTSTTKFSPWNIQGLQPISEFPVQETVGTRKFLDGEEICPKTCHRGK